MSYKLLTLLLITYIFCEDAPKAKKKDEFVPKATLDDYFKELGLEGKESLTRDELRKLYHKVITTSEKQKKTMNTSPKDDSVIEEMLDKLVEGVPDEFLRKDLDLYLNKDRFLDMISNILGGIDLRDLAKKVEEREKKEGLAPGTLRHQSKKFKPDEGDDEDVKTNEYGNDL